MVVEQDRIRKKANTYFFSKVAFNVLLIVLGAVLIGLFLRQIQRSTALSKQRENSEIALQEAVTILEKNAEDHYRKNQKKAKIKKKLNL